MSSKSREMKPWAELAQLLDHSSYRYATTVYEYEPYLPRIAIPEFFVHGLGEGHTKGANWRAVRQRTTWYYTIRLRARLAAS